MADQFAWYKEAIDGRRGDITDEPMSGFYRNRRRGQQAEAIAYWRDTKNGNLRCQIDGEDVDEMRARETWPFASKEPIAHEMFKAKMSTGKWPDMDDAAFSTLPLSREVVGGNNPPADSLDILREQIESAKAGAVDYSKISDDQTAAKAQSLRSRLLELSGSADKKREAEKRPHFEAGKAVDEKWQPLVKMAKAAADSIRSALSAWETEKDRKTREVFRLAEEARRKAEDEAKAAEAAGLPAAPIPPPVAPPVQVSAPIKGAYGRAGSVKQIKVAVITDQAKVYETFKDRPEVIELLRKLSQKAIDDGYDVPGITVDLQRKVS